MSVMGEANVVFVGAGHARDQLMVRGHGPLLHRHSPQTSTYSADLMRPMLSAIMRIYQERDGLNSSSRFFADTPANPFFERIAVLRGARTLVVLRVLSRVLRSWRLALHLEKLNDQAYPTAS